MWTQQNAGVRTPSDPHPLAPACVFTPDEKKTLSFRKKRLSSTSLYTTYGILKVIGVIKRANRKRQFTCFSVLGAKMINPKFTFRLPSKMAAAKKKKNKNAHKNWSFSSLFRILINLD